MKNLRIAGVLIIGIGLLALRVAGILTGRGHVQVSSTSIPGAGANGYSAVVVPSIKPEKVGQPATIGFRVSNGSKLMPHLTLTFDNLTNWQVQRVGSSSSNRPQAFTDLGSSGWDFGPLARDAVRTIQFHVLPIKPEQLSVSLSIFGSYDGVSRPDSGDEITSGTVQLPVRIETGSLPVAAAKLDGVPLVPAPVGQPEAIALDRHGNLYIGDTDSNYVLKFSPFGKLLGRFGSSSDSFIGPEGVAVDAQVNVYVSDSGNYRIVKLSPRNKVLAVWGSEGSGPGQFKNPYGIALDRTGNVYVTDYDLLGQSSLSADANRLHKFSPSGKVLAVWSDTENFVYGVLREPEGVAVDSFGSMYVTNLDNGGVHKLSPGGKELIGWNTPDSAAGVAVDPRGDVLVTDTVTNEILKYSRNGKLLRTWGGSGKKPGQFSNPHSLAIDKQGRIYVADTDNGRVQILSATGKPLRILG